MDAVTYPDEKVSGYINANLIPLRLQFDDKTHAENYKIKWTPTIIVLDTDGQESHRSVGFLATDELIPALQLGIGKAHFEAGRFDRAISAFDKLLEDHSGSEAAPEAIFYRGVATYKHTNNPKPLREVYDKLNAEYPDSEWTKKAHPYRLID
ncbi:MAG: tetratricopeptide repeat protein [Desulfomonilaceae bacterium]|nr:tetratricopeptide repeat protein [Desulfomonilaceae bacterium]